MHPWRVTVMSLGDYLIRYQIRYVQRAMFYADSYTVHSRVIPPRQDKIGKENTWSIDGFNNRIRLSVSRQMHKIPLLTDLHLHLPA